MTTRLTYRTTVGIVLSYQIQEAICKRIGHKGYLHQCVIGAKGKRDVKNVFKYVRICVFKCLCLCMCASVCVKIKKIKYQINWIMLTVVKLNN